MHPASKRRRTARLWFYVAVVLLVISVWGIQMRVYERYSAPGTIFSGSSGTPSAPNDWEKMTIQAMTATETQLTSLATALLGAMGLLISNKTRDGSSWRHMWAAFLGAAFAGRSDERVGLDDGHACPSANRVPHVVGA